MIANKLPLHVSVKRLARPRTGFYMQYSIVDLVAECPVVTARWYCGRDGAAPNKCALWVHDKADSRCGYGVAKGYGYHKPSESLDRAITYAGYRISESIGGVGEQAIESALLALGATVTANKLMIVKASD